MGRGKTHAGRIPLLGVGTGRFEVSMIEAVDERSDHLAVRCRVESLGDITVLVDISPWAACVGINSVPGQSDPCLVITDGCSICAGTERCWHRDLVTDLEDCYPEACTRLRENWHITSGPSAHVLTAWTDLRPGAVHVARLFDDDFTIRYRDQGRSKGWSWEGTFSGALPEVLLGVRVPGAQVWHSVLLAPEVRALEPLLSARADAVARVISEPYATYPVVAADPRNPEDAPAIYIDYELLGILLSVGEARVALRRGLGSGMRFYASIAAGRGGAQECRAGCPAATDLTTCPHRDLRDFCRLLAPLLEERRPDIERALRTGRKV